MSRFQSAAATPREGLDASQILGYLASLSDVELRETLSSDPNLLHEINSLFPDITASAGLSGVANMLAGGAGSPAGHEQYRRGGSAGARGGAGRGNGTPRRMYAANGGGSSRESVVGGVRVPNNTPAHADPANLGGIDLSQLNLDPSMQGGDPNEILPLTIPLPKSPFSSQADQTSW
ncbi:hypothetical protein BT69DRAFT_576683 [Atractiella rhizophila]|nr:hypothetical protein BT69DRAFT_576683 [Atractiella rhizophila]